MAQLASSRDDDEEGFYDEKEELTVAWGGVAAQVALAVPLILLDLFTDLRHVFPASAVITVFGYVSLIFAVINLLPFPGLDGAKARRLIPLLHSEWHERRAFARRRRTRD